MPPPSNHPGITVPAAGRADTVRGATRPAQPRDAIGAAAETPSGEGRSVPRTKPQGAAGPAIVATPPHPAKLPRRTHEERRTATREALLAAAIAVIAEQGYASTTTNLIAERAGVTRGALQYHFASREDTILAVIDHVMTELNFRLDTAGLAGLPLAERVEALVSRYREVFSGPLFVTAMQILLGVRSDPVLSARIRAHLNEKQDAILRTWAEIFPDVEMAEGEMASLRRIIMAAIRGYVLLEAFGVPGSWNKDSPMLGRLLTSAF